MIQTSSVIILPSILGPAASTTGEAADGIADIWRACDPGRGVLARGPFSFRPQSSLDHAALGAVWTAWLVGEFAPCLMPALLEAREHAANGRASELRELDIRLSQHFSERAAECLSAAGRMLLEDACSLRALTWPRKVSAWAVAGKCRAFFPTIFAGRCASFHLSPRTLLLGYALCEWHAGYPRSTEQETDLAFHAVKTVLQISPPSAPAFLPASASAAGEAAA